MMLGNTSKNKAKRISGSLSKGTSKINLGSQISLPLQQTANI